MSKFLHTDVKAIAIPLVFSENCQAKKCFNSVLNKLSNMHFSSHITSTIYSSNWQNLWFWKRKMLSIFHIFKDVFPQVSKSLVESVVTN